MATRERSSASSNLGGATMEDFESAMLAAINDRVVDGALWLDRTCAGWESRLTARLDVSSWETCVLGQLSSEYESAAEATEYEPAWLVDHGFLLGAGVLLSYNDLSAAWEALVYARGACRLLAPARLVRPRGVASAQRRFGDSIARGPRAHTSPASSGRRCL
jgi:hypothetical protein